MVPPRRRAQVSSLPVLASEKSAVGPNASARRSYPQQMRDPVLRTPQAYREPTVAHLKAPVGRCVSRSELLGPQQRREPWLWMPHAAWSPAERYVNRPRGALAWDPQQTAAPCTSNAHAMRDPTLT